MKGVTENVSTATPINISIKCLSRLFDRRGLSVANRVGQAIANSTYSSLPRISHGIGGMNPSDGTLRAMTIIRMNTNGMIYPIAQYPFGKRALNRPSRIPKPISRSIPNVSVNGNISIPIIKPVYNSTASSVLFSRTIP